MTRKKFLLQYLFWTFDIYKKEVLIEENLKKFKPWNFILLKRHYYFLLKPLLTMIIALLLFWGLIWMNFNHFWTNHLTYFFIISWLYFLFTFQWLGVSIWYIVYAIKHSKVVYKEVDSFLEKDNQIFLRFVNQTMLSFTFQIILCLVNVFLSFFVKWEIELITWLSIVWELAINIIFLFVIYNIFKRLVDFNMDFTTVSPLKIVSYSQEWIQNFSAKDLATDTIKSVTVVQSGFIQSVFNIWRILIKGIGDETSSKEYSISLNHVKFPEKVKEEIDFVRNKREIFIDK